jgi:hypothetical protein
MITNYEQIEQITLHILELSKIADYFSWQEKKRLAEFFYNALEEFEEAYPVDSFDSAGLWESNAKRILVSQLDELEDVFGIKGLSLKLDIDALLKTYYELEIGS